MKQTRESPVLGAGGVVIDHRRDGPLVVLIKRRNEPAAGRWSLPGGRVERGETIAEAVAREVLEETGLVVTVGPLVEVVEIIDAASHYVVVDHRCEIKGGILRAGDDAADAVFAPVYDLAPYDLTAAVRRVIAKAVADERE